MVPACFQPAFMVVQSCLSHSGSFPPLSSAFHTPPLPPSSPRRSCVFGALGGRNSVPKVPLPPSHLAGSLPVLVRDPNVQPWTSMAQITGLRGRWGRGRGRHTYIHTEGKESKRREGIQSIPRSQPWLVSVSISVLSVF